MSGPIASAGLSAGGGWVLWLAVQPWRSTKGGVYPSEAESAFLAGYALARSQSTQGSGFWNPETGADS